MDQLTVRQKDVLEYVEKYVCEYTVSPTVNEIAQAIGVRSTGVVYRYLKALQDHGYISLLPGRHRNIRMTQKGQSGLPLVGTIAAGLPIEAIPVHEWIDVGQSYASDKHFVLQVEGESMTNLGILSEDFIICKKTSCAHYGQVVVALIDNEYTTLKTYKPSTNGCVTLSPANDAFDNQEYASDRVQVQAVYVALFRRV